MRADRLVVEVLEVDHVERDPAAMESLTALRRLGVIISIDDFGAGYANLTRVRALRPDVIKIDRSLVEGSDDEGGAALLGTAVSIGRQVGAKVVAEGVETAEQFAAVLHAGCDGVQGHYFSRPLSASALHDFARVHPSAPAAVAG